MNKDILFFGMQGSGKGTQAKILLERLDKHISFEPGQIFRALTKNDNLLGNYVKERTHKGMLVEDNMTISIYEACCQTLEVDQFLLLD
jgi:adenylate kinase family enzyme